MIHQKYLMTELFTSPAAQGLWTCVVLAIASAAVAITITQTEMFAPLRAAANKAGHQIGHLFHCFYCISHWIVIAGIIAYRPVLISSGAPIIDWIVSTFFTIAISALFSGMIFRVFLSAMAKKTTEMQLKKMMSQG